MELILVGDQEYKIKKKFCRRHNITVLSKKSTQELAKIYASSHCFIFPSTTDTLGQVVLEAMSSGLPVLVTNEGGPQTFVDDSCGYVLDLNRKEYWMDALKELILNDELYGKKSEAAYAKVRMFSIKNSFEDFWSQNCKIYEKLSK